MRWPKIFSYSCSKAAAIAAVGADPLLGDRNVDREAVLLALIPQVKGPFRAGAVLAAAGPLAQLVEELREDLPASPVLSSERGANIVWAVVWVTSAPSSPQAEKFPVKGGMTIVGTSDSRASSVANRPPPRRTPSAPRRGGRATLDRDLADRVGHVGRGDAHPLGHPCTSMFRVEPSADRAVSAGSLSSSSPPARWPSPSMPSANAASVTVASVPPRP